MLLAMISVLTVPRLILTLKPFGNEIKNIMTDLFDQFIENINYFDLSFFVYCSFFVLQCFSKVFFKFNFFYEMDNFINCNNYIST